MKKYLCILIQLMLLLPLHAQTKAQADSAYAAERYDEAAAVYSALLKQGEHADIYYNLGNCYYKTGRMAQAILNYERAHLLAPSDGDIRFNLELARTKTIDKIVPESEMFFVDWYRSLVNMAGADAWAKTGVIAFILMGLLVMLYLFSNKIGYKKVGFFGAVVMLVIVIFANIFAWQQNEKLTNRDAAIVMTTSVMVKSTPNDSGTDLFVLHEGTRVELIDQSMKDWKEIRLADGKIGWLKAKDIEVI